MGCAPGEWAVWAVQLLEIANIDLDTFNYFAPKDPQTREPPRTSTHSAQAAVCAQTIILTGA